MLDAWNIFKYLTNSATWMLCKGADTDFSGFHSCNILSYSHHSSSTWTGFVTNFLSPVHPKVRSEMFFSGILTSPVSNDVQQLLSEQVNRVLFIK